jgi:hypothetical protein
VIAPPNENSATVSFDSFPVLLGEIQKPDALTPEVMVFFGLMVFLAIFGARRGGA